VKNFLIYFILIFVTIPGYAKHTYLEKDYQNYWCKLNNGIAEYRLDDATRIDCLTGQYAIEFDFANKWAEAIGQTLYYSLSTNKKPGIVLIIEDETKDIKHLKRLKKICKCYKIKIWTITPKDLCESNIYN